MRYGQDLDHSTALKEGKSLAPSNAKGHDKVLYRTRNLTSSLWRMVYAHL